MKNNKLSRKTSKNQNMKKAETPIKHMSNERQAVYKMADSLGISYNQAFAEVNEVMAEYEFEDLEIVS